MSKPIIGIVGRENISKIEREVKFGGIPLAILPIQDISYSVSDKKSILEMAENEKQNLIQILKICDGIIVPGGHRIFEYDKFICKYAIDNNIPLLGVCLGMQTMASIDCFEERIIEPINNGINHKVEEKFAHKVNVNKDSFLYSIVKNEEFVVNSKHKCNIIKTNRFDIVRIF